VRVLKLVTLALKTIDINDNKLALVNLLDISQ